MKKRTLNNGVEIPSIGMGTYPLRGNAMTNAVVAAVKCGYRLFDTAYAYENEICLGVALKEAFRVTGLNRSNIIITSKIGEKLNNGIPDGKLFYASFPNEKKDIRNIVKNQLEEILNNLQTDYLDILLIHWPHPDYLNEIWEAVECEYRSGKVRAIGVSNCRERHLKRIIKNGSIRPMVNQFELHPLNTKKNLISFCQQHSIQVQAFSPLSVMNRKLTECSLLKSLSKKYYKSIAQIILRWHIQQGVIPIPKSGNPIRLQENIDIFDFEVTDDDMISIDSLNVNFKGLVESIYCPGY